MQHPWVNIAIKAARRAGNIITRSLEKHSAIKVAQKGFHDWVSSVDLAVEKDIIDTIRKAYPKHSIQAEESGYTAGDETVWVIDPIDGTQNFIHAYPQYAVSIGIKHKGQYEHAVIYDPITQDLYTASKGSGAQLNGRRIRVSEKPFNAALIGVGLPYSQHGRSPAQLQRHLGVLSDLYQSVADTRLNGSAALSLAYVASGKLEGYYQSDLSEWDFAAGLLLVQEAGGLVTNFDGEKDFSAGHIVAGAPKIQTQLIERIKTAELSSAL